MIFETSLIGRICLKGELSVADKSRPPETSILRQVEQILVDRLPPSWSARIVRAPGRPSSRRRESSLRIRAPDGESIDLTLEVKRVLNPQDASRLLDSLEIGAPARARSPESIRLVIAAPYLGDRAREVIAARGVSYADATGNVRLLSEKPAMFVMTTGADRDPWPDDQPLKSLRGRGAGRCVRAVVDFRPPYGVRELAARAEVSPATLARVIDLLARDALLTRDARGGVTAVDWAGCLRRWSKDYEFTTSNRVTSFVAPRGLSDITAKLAEVKWRYAATGSIAAQALSPIAPLRQAMLYVDDIDSARRALDAREADEGANLLIAEPFDEVVYERTTTVNGLSIVAPSQAAADLLTGSGRMPSEGEELLDWMKANERVWRR